MLQRPPARAGAAPPGKIGDGELVVVKKKLMNNTNSKTSVQGATVQSEQLNDRDVILSVAYDGRFCVMPLDKRHTQFFRSFAVAKVTAQVFANETGGRVIMKANYVNG